MSAAAAIPRERWADYAYCQRLASRHYENFQVASRLLPAALRPHLAAIYAYCRGVDDLGDEWPGDRLAALAEWERELDACFAGRAVERPEFRALAHTIAAFDLPKAPFLALIEANRQDQRQRAYPTYQDLLGYCRLSAAPVGRLVLALFGYRDPELERLSDATCIALQLTNFWQDVRDDLARGRLYIPLEDLAAFGVTREELERGRFTEAVAALMRFEVERTRELFAVGAALEECVRPRLAFQLRLYRLGGEAVLSAIARAGYSPFARPRLSSWAKLGIALQAMVRRAGRPTPNEVNRGECGTGL